MIRMDLEGIKVLKQSIEYAFTSESGKIVMEFMELICNWYPLAGDSSATNDVVARDAKRQVLATIKTFIKHTPEDIIKIKDAM